MHANIHDKCEKYGLIYAFILLHKGVRIIKIVIAINLLK